MDLLIVLIGDAAINGNQTLTNALPGQDRKTLTITATPFCGQESVSMERRLRPGYTL